MLQEDGSESCQCPLSCPLSYKPVCANNKKTYVNRCALDLDTCLTNGSVVLAHEGKCCKEFQSSVLFFFFFFNLRFRLCLNFGAFGLYKSKTNPSNARQSTRKKHHKVKLLTGSAIPRDVYFLFQGILVNYTTLKL